VYGTATMPPMSGRDRAAVRIQCMGRKYMARARVRTILLKTYFKDIDKVTSAPIWQNVQTKETLFQEPRIIASLKYIQLNEVDTGEKWECAYCETKNKGNAKKCKVCKREKSASEKKRREDREKKEREEAAAKAIEDEKLAQKRMADAKEANEKAALRIPYVPTGAGARATAKGAVLWWTPGVDVGKPLIRHIVKKYRLDDGEWKCRGEIDAPAEIHTFTMDEGLNFGRQFKFEIIAENEDGQSPPSNFTNIIEAGLVLPDGWEKVHDKSGRPYYFHRAENRVSWTVPRPDRYQVSPDLRMKFKVGEIDEFKNLFKMYDTDGSGEVDREELAQMLKRMGERLKASQLDALLRKIDDDGSGEINFQEFCQMVFWMREGKLGMGGKFLRSFGKGMGSIFKKAKKLVSKKTMSEEERTRRKLGNWEMHVNQNIGKPYFFNKKTGETRWRRPDEILFWLPDDIKEKFTEREIERFQEDFAAMDLDGGGSLDEEELHKCFESMNINIDGKKLRKMIAMFDDDGR
jgi:Ca2+-binding EF-hand superfamily protein